MEQNNNNCLSSVAALCEEENVGFCEILSRNFGKILVTFCFANNRGLNIV